MKVFALLITLILTGLFSCERISDQPAIAVSPPPDTALFTLVHPARSGLLFNNELTEGPNTNILMYEYFYNGGGVATGDLNGDGLIDVYMTSNMQPNKLFINTGALTFRDATAASRAGGRPGPWKTGVSIADVNGDNRLDIFVCYSGTVREENRLNQLFINQGNNDQNIPTFSDESAAYGLTQPAYSNQAYFFDFDRDSDLDILLLNHNPVNLPVLNEASTAAMLRKDDPQKGVRLLRQDKGKFKDVTTTSGINGSALSYGLGASVADLNNDRWPDIYISNDYSVPDYLYLNNGDGTFTDTKEKTLGHTSQFSMGNDVADINNDGLPEIFTLDMLPEDNRRQKLLMSPDNYAKFELNVRSGFYYQYMRNMLHLNNGDGTFSEIGQMANISATDWSWAALLADYDNDGYKDLFVTNGYVRDYTNLDFIKYMDEYVKSKGRLVREEVLDLIRHMPASDISNYIFSNHKGETFHNQTREWGLLRNSNSNGAAYADLDNDGDLDLIINNINQAAFLYRNNAERKGNRSLAIQLKGSGGNTAGIGSKVTLWHNGKIQVAEQTPGRGYLSAVTPVLHLGLGNSAKVDSIRVDWPSGKSELKKTFHPGTYKLVFDETNAAKVPQARRAVKPVFVPATDRFSLNETRQSINDFKRQPLLLSQLSYLGPKLIKGDVDNDGREDVYVTGAGGSGGRLFLQQHDRSFLERKVADFEMHSRYADADAVFADMNGDGSADLYVASGGYHTFDPGDELLQDRVYLNDGSGNLAFADTWLPVVNGAKGCVVAADFTGDGRVDLFVGGRAVPGRYPETPESYLLINEGGRFSDRTEAMAPQLRRIGMVTDAAALDANGDGRVDLAVAGEWMPVSVFINEGKAMADRTSAYFEKPLSGWWNSLDTADLNSDGITDLIAGNLGLNSQCRASDAQPAEMFYKDFDNNGSVDPIFCFYIQGKRYPYVTRDELLEQIGAMRSRFPDYKSYADATITDIVSKEDLEDAGHLTANEFRTSVFLGSTAGFAHVPLPRQAQYSPVYAALALDFDGDGHQDILLGGNNSRMRLRIGQYDASYGILLKGHGDGRFQYVDQQASGLSLTGDVRGIAMIGDDICFGINERPIVTYKLRRKVKMPPALANAR